MGKNQHWVNCMIFGVAGLVGLLCYYYWPHVWAKILFAIMAILCFIGAFSPFAIFYVFVGMVVSVVVGAMIGIPDWVKKEREIKQIVV